MTGVVVVFPKLENGKNIKSILVRSGYRVLSVCTTGAQAIQDAGELQDGIVICTYRLPDMMYWELKECLPKGFVMVVISSASQWDANGDTGVVNLILPLKVHELLATMEQLSSSLLRSRKKRRNAPKQRSPEEQQLIDTAKEVLMKQRGISEVEAHRYLQKTSMDNGTSFVETAQMILSMMG